MKKLALLLCGIGALAFVSASASDYVASQNEPQAQEQCQPAPCYPDSTCYMLPCNLPAADVPCTTDTICNPAPCNVAAPCYTPTPCTTPAPTQTQNTSYNGCC